MFCMRIGIFSDVHGDLYSLEKAYHDLRVNHIDLIINLGDSIVKGHDINEDLVVEFIKDRKKIFSIQGNHDRKRNKKFKYISPENEDFLNSLSEYFIFGDLIAFHSSLRSPDEYLFNENVILKEYNHIRENIGIFKFHLFGHVHQKQLYRIDKDNNVHQDYLTGPFIRLDQQSNYFICPGALSNFSYDKSSYAILDCDENSLEFKISDE